MKKKDNDIIKKSVQTSSACGLTIASALCHKHALAEEKDSNSKRTVR